MFWSCLHILCPDKFFSFTICQKGSVGHNNVVFFLIAQEVSHPLSAMMTLCIFLWKMAKTFDERRSTEPAIDFKTDVLMIL